MERAQALYLFYFIFSYKISDTVEGKNRNYQKALRYQKICVDQQYKNLSACKKESRTTKFSI